MPRVRRSKPPNGTPRRRRWGWRLAAWTLGILVLVTALPVIVLRWVNPPTTAFMLEARAALPAGESLHQQWVAYDHISPPMRLAVVASEDQRFPFHHGFDWTQIGDALSAWQRGQPLRGASTISQQTAKNVFLWPAHSLVRKAIEAWFTVLLETIWGKRRILEVYLNFAQFGPRTFGVGAAARRFFHEPAARITRAQAALLAAVLPDPQGRSVRRPSAFVRQRQREILRQMSNLGAGYLRVIKR